MIWLNLKKNTKKDGNVLEKIQLEWFVLLAWLVLLVLLQWLFSNYILKPIKKVKLWLFLKQTQSSILVKQDASTVCTDMEKIPRKLEIKKQSESKIINKPRQNN